LLQGVQLTEKERRDLEYKEQVYKLAVERKKQLGGRAVMALAGLGGDGEGRAEQGWVM